MKAGWTTETISSVTSVVNGGTPKSKVAEYWGGHVQWLTPKDMGKMEVREIASTPRTITEAGLSGSSARVVPANSVILSTRAPIGHLAVNTTPMAFNQGCRGIVPGEKLDPVFLYYYLLSSKESLDALGSGTTFKELSATNLKSFEIPLPPLEEQKRIVAVLDEAFAALDRARTHAETNLKNARELFESYLASIFSGQTSDWTMRSFGDNSFIKIVDGDRGANYPKKSDFLSEGHCLFLNTKNVRPDGFSFDATMFITEEKDKALRKGKLERRDVVLTTRGTIGNIALYDGTVEFEDIRINSGMLILRPNEEIITSEYLFELLRSHIVKAQIDDLVSGAAQPQLPIKSLVKFEVPVPKSLTEQTEIVGKLNELSEECASLTNSYTTKLADLDDLRQSLLQKAFAGELT